jgi:hypothetical protein
LTWQPADCTKKLLAFLAIDREWVPPNQVQGIINLKDLAKVAGEESVKRLLAAVPR